MYISHQLQVFPFGTKAKGMLDEQHIPYAVSIGDISNNDLVLIVSDDTVKHGAEISQVLSTVGIGRHVYLVLDLSESSDTEKCRTMWTHYNKVEDAQTIRDLVTLILRHLVQPSMIAFDPFDLVEICAQGEYIGSIYVEKGVEGLSKTNAPTNAIGLAGGVGFENSTCASMEQMNYLHEFFQKLSENTEIRWSISSAHKDEVVFVYSYNK